MKAHIMKIIAKHHFDAVVHRKENHTIFNIEMVLERKKTGRNVVIETDGNNLIITNDARNVLIFISDDQKDLMIMPVLCRMPYLVTMLAFIGDQ